MSYDFGVKSPDEIDCEISMTSNVGGMWHLAMGISMKALKDRPCRECLPILRRGIKMMKEYPEAFKALNPPNGFGDTRDALNTLKKVATMCKSHPDMLLHIWY